MTLVFAPVPTSTLSSILMKRSAFFALLLSLVTVLAASAQQAVKPMKVLLITGGCCHEYGKQKDILKKGLEARANIVVDQMHSDDTTTKPTFPFHTNPDWAKGYDLVIHDECSSDIKDEAIVKNILKAHADGIPAVNLHCAMHSYRTGKGEWFDYLGLESSSHGPQVPIELAIIDDSHPITKGTMAWTTINEELYNNVKIYDSAHPLIRGKQGAGDDPAVNNTVVTWTHEYGAKKTRVFSTTLGHNSETVADDRYLDMVSRGLLWAAGKLKDDGTPVAGYGPK